MKCNNIAHAVIVLLYSVLKHAYSRDEGYLVAAQKNTTHWTLKELYALLTQFID